MKKNKLMAIALSLCLLLPSVSVAATEDYMSNVSASILNADGNILFDIDESAVLSLDASGITAVSEPMYAKVGIKTSAGDLISNAVVDFSDSKTASYTISNIPEYGVYDIEIGLYGKTSGRYYGKLASSFSAVNGPKAGTLNPVHGVCLHYRDGQDSADFGDSMITADLAAKAGFSSVRGEVTWEKYASYDDSGNAAYSLADRQQNIIKKVDDLGMDVLEVLSYDHTKYPMANTSGGYNSNMTNAFTAYAESLSDKILTLNSDAEFEIWNEWNNEGSWFNEKSLSPQTYAKLAKAVYEKIGSKTTLWGMSTLGVDTDWIEEVLEEWDDDGYFWENKNDNQQLYMDGISVHPYTNWSQPEGSTYINTPLWTADNPVYAGVVSETQTLKNMLESRGIGQTPLRATEWGWVSTGVKAYQNNSSTDSTQIFVGYYPDRTMQAAYFVRMAALSEAKDLYDKMNYYQINSKNGKDDSDYGLLLSSTNSVPYGAKPAYLAAANYNRLMTGAGHGTNAVTETDGVYTAWFTLADGRDCAIIWSAALDSNRTKSENVAKNITLTVGDTEVTVCDMLGNEITAESSSGAYNFKVNGEPVYVMGNFTSKSVASASNGSMIAESYYNAFSDSIVLNADCSNITAVLKQNSETKQEFNPSVAGGKVSASLNVDSSLEAGDYDLEVTADGVTYTKTVTIPQRTSQNGQIIQTSSFEPGMVALYTASSKTVRVIGKLTGRSENEPIVVMVAKQPAEGTEFSETDIAYVQVFDGSTEDFDFSFTLPDGAYGDYVVRAGSKYAVNAMQNGLANPDEAVVCTFTASVSGDTFSATGTFANYSSEDSKYATIIIAQYGENGNLVKVKMGDYTVTKTGGVTEPETVSDTLDSDAVTCKAFVWNSGNKLVPLVSSITIPNVKGEN